MWLEWGIRLVTLLALVVVVAGLLVLALPDGQEGREVLQLDATHAVRMADLVGAVMVALGAFLIWAAVLTWQRRRIQ